MRAVIFYILSYLFSVTIFFSVISYSFSYSRGELTTLNDLAAFCKGNVFQAACTTVVLFSLAGLPPFIGFFGKYFILLALFDSGLSFVLFIFFLFNAFSVYYYIRLVQIVWTNQAQSISFQSAWLTTLEYSFFVPGQQLYLKYCFFFLLPFFLSDILELAVLLSYNDCPWI
jgi:NADH:ubiquinone oxidoreductase subunit 2 (subunit N)